MTATSQWTRKPHQLSDTTILHRLTHDLVLEMLTEVSWNCGGTMGVLKIDEGKPGSRIDWKCHTKVRVWLSLDTKTSEGHLTLRCHCPTPKYLLSVMCIENPRSEAYPTIPGAFTRAHLNTLLWAWTALTACMIWPVSITCCHPGIQRVRSWTCPFNVILDLKGQNSQSKRSQATPTPL